MNISSYNIADTAYHLIGLRVLSGMASKTTREQQTAAISRSVLKYVNDRSLRLMLPAPKGTFESVGEKIIQELVHFGLARAPKGGSVELTESGKQLLGLLNDKQHVELRRKLVELHIRTYDNLRNVLQRHMELSYVLMPVVEARDIAKGTKLADYLYPTFGDESEELANSISDILGSTSASRIEDALRKAILKRVFSDPKPSVALSRAIFDRLVSLRLLNIMKWTERECEFAKSYSPCKLSPPDDEWHRELTIELKEGETYRVFFAEPNMGDPMMQEKLLIAIDRALMTLVPKAGYYDLPEVRDLSCDSLMIPEAAFDEGINVLLDKQPSPVTVGLTYEGISARRKPLIRSRVSTQIFNLIRRV